MTLLSIISSAFLLIGGFFSLVAALGILRFDNFYARIHAATKASTFGLGFVAIAVAMTFGSLSVWFKVCGTMVFLFITLPVGAHLLGRAFKRNEQRRASGVILDDSSTISPEDRGQK